MNNGREEGDGLLSRELRGGAPWRRPGKIGLTEHSQDPMPYGYYEKTLLGTTFRFAERGGSRESTLGMVPHGLPDLHSLGARVGQGSLPPYVWTPRDPNGVATLLCDYLLRPLAHRKRRELRKAIGISALTALLWLFLLGSMGGRSVVLPFSIVFGLLPLIVGIGRLLVFVRRPLYSLRGDRENFLFQQWLGDRLPKVSLALGAGLVALGCLHFFVVGTLRGIEAAALDPVAISEGQVWRLLSGPLIHGNVLHLMLNVLALVVLGRIVERVWGGATVVCVFALSAWIGALFSWQFLVAERSVGASGGVLGLLAFLALVAGRRSEWFPRQLPLGLGMNLLIIMALGLSMTALIDNAAHLGGILTGAALGCWYAWRTAPIKQWPTKDPHSFRLSAPLIVGLLAGSALWTVLALLA